MSKVSPRGEEGRDGGRERSGSGGSGSGSNRARTRSRTRSGSGSGSGHMYRPAPQASFMSPSMTEGGTVGGAGGGTKGGAMGGTGGGTGAVAGTDEGRRRQNVFHPNLFDDNFAKEMIRYERVSDEDRKKRGENFSCPFVDVSKSINDVVASKVKSTTDRFNRSLEAKALAEVVMAVPLPYTVGVCAPGGHGKTFYFRLLKKALDPGVTEDPVSGEMWQRHEKKAARVRDRIACEQFQSEKLFEAEANETVDQYHNRELSHGVDVSEPENAYIYRLKKLFRPLWTCFRYLICCFPLFSSNRHSDNRKVHYWILVLRVLFFGMWHEWTESVRSYFQSLYLGHDYQQLSMNTNECDQKHYVYRKKSVNVNKHSPSQFESGDKIEEYRGAESIFDERERGPKVESLTPNGSNVKEYIFVNFNPAWECVNLLNISCGKNTGSKNCDVAHHLLLTLVACIFRSVELRLQQQQTISDDNDSFLRSLMKRLHENYKSRLRLKQSIRILVDVYGNTLQIRLRVLLLVISLINLVFAFLVVVQHLVIQIFFQRYDIQNVVLRWLIPHTTWFFVMNCLILSLILGTALSIPIFRFLTLIWGTADHSYIDSSALLDYLNLSVKHDPFNRDGIVHLIRKELLELFAFLKENFTSGTGIEPVIVLFIDDLDKVQHHQSIDSSKNGEMILKFFESLKYVLLTIEHAPVILFMSMDRATIATQLEHSTNNVISESSTAVAPPIGPRSLPVWGFEYLDNHVFDMTFYLPELTKDRVQHFMSSTILPSHDYMIQNALRAVFGLLEHLNMLDVVAVEFFNVEFLENLALSTEVERLYQLSDDFDDEDEPTAVPSSIAGRKGSKLSVTSVNGRRNGSKLSVSSSYVGRKGSKLSVEGNVVEKTNAEFDIAAANDKAESLNIIRGVEAKDHFQQFFYGCNDSVKAEPTGDQNTGPNDNIKNNSNTGREEVNEELHVASNDVGNSNVVDTENIVNCEGDSSLNDLNMPIRKMVFRAKTLRSQLNRLNESWQHLRTPVGNTESFSVMSRQAGIMSFLIATGRILTSEINDAINLYEAGVPEGIEIFCTALTKIMLNVRISFRFTATPSPVLLIPANGNPSISVEDPNIWKICHCREVKRTVVDTDTLQNVIMKDSHGNLIDMSKVHGKNFLEVNNHGRVAELTPLEVKKIKSDVIKQVKRRDIIQSQKRELFADDDERKAIERARRRLLRKSIRFILCIEWSSCGRYLMFACNDGVVAVVDYFTNMEKVAGELYREDTSGDPSKEPVKIKISCISMSPSTSYLAVGGSDGKVAIYDTTSDWCEIQLLDFSSHNDVADSRAPKQVKITALSWSPNSSYLIIGDNRGNIFLVTTMGRVSLPGSMASSGRSSAIVEMQLPSDEPTPKLAWRVVKAVFNKKYSYRAHRSQRCRSVNKTSTKGKSKKDRSRARTYSAGTEENSESGQSHHPPSDDDDSDNDDGYNELRHDPLETVTCMKWNMDMSYIVVGRINHVITLYLFDKETLGEKIVHLAGHQGSITCVAIAQSSNWLVSGSEDNTLRIWNVKRALEMRMERSTAPEIDLSLCVSVLAGHSLKVTGVSITPSDRYIISASKDGELVMWSLENGERYSQQQDRSVMAMSISADLQLLAHASDEDGTLRVARLESNIHTRFVGTTLHSIHESLCHTQLAAGLDSKETFPSSLHKNKLVEIDFKNVDSTCLMAEVSHNQLDVLSHMNEVLQPFLTHSNVSRMRRIVQIVHLVNRWIASKRVDKSIVDSNAQGDPRWEIFSLKVAQWVYLCEYFPFRMSLLIHCCITMNYHLSHDHRDERNGSTGIGEIRLCDFFCDFVKKKLRDIKSSELLMRLDGPSEAFLSLIAVTPSDSIAKTMFASTFQQKFRLEKTNKSPDGCRKGTRNSSAATLTAPIDLSNIICSDILACVPTTGSSNSVGFVNAENFRFSLLECTFNIDPKIRSLIGMEMLNQ